MQKEALNSEVIKMKNEQSVSPQRQEYLHRRRRYRRTITFLRISLCAVFLLLWEALTRLGVLDPFIVSSPTRCIKTIINLFKEGTLFVHIGVTVAETLIGFAAGTILGFLIALLLWSSETARRVADPYLVVLNALPKIALGPIIIVWIGSGMGAIVTITLLISIVVSVIGMLNGFLEVDPEKVFLLRSLGADKRRIFTMAVLPSSIPAIMSTLKINVGMAWVGVIVGEFLSSKNGLGYLLVYGGQVFRLDLVMASIVILCILAGIMYYFVSLLEKRICRAMSE